MNGRVSTWMCSGRMQIKDQTGLFTAKLSVKNLLRDSEESALFETIGVTNIDARGIIHGVGAAEKSVHSAARRYRRQCTMRVCKA